MEGRAISGDRLPIPMSRADDLNRMSARKLIYRFMVLAPAIFLAGIGVNARSISTEFDTVCNDARTDRAILAYIPYMRELEAPYREHSESDRRRALNTANQWIAAANKGVLMPLAPIAYEDTSTEGAKSQVFEAKANLISRLSTAIGEEIDAGQYNRAAEYTARAMRLSEILKYSDFISLYNCATEQRRQLMTISPYIVKLDSQHKQLLSSAVKDCATEETQVNRMARRSNRLFLSWRMRKNYQPLSIEDTKLLAEIPAMVTGDSAVSLADFRNRMFATRDANVPNYCSSVRLGLTATKWLDKERAEALRKLEPK